MKAPYWDTSCVLALYVPELISTQASELVSEEKGPIHSSAKEIAARILQAETPVFLRTLEGIHIATALELGSPELITADKKMADAANLLGIKARLLKEFTIE